MTRSQCINFKKITVTDTDAATDDASFSEINTAPHAPNAATNTDAASATAENKMSVRQLLDGQEYPVAKGGIIKKGFDRKADVERCMAYLHVISQLPGCHGYTGYIITSCTWLQLLHSDYNAILGAA